MWNCVEDRVGGDKYGGRVIRKIIFDDIYADRIAVLSQNPISRTAYPHLKSGDKIVFYDNTEIREGNFLLSSEQKSNYLNSKAIIGEVLSTEEEIRNFCKSHGIAKNTQSLHLMVIEAYLFLERKINSAREHNLPDNTGSSRMNRKRPAPVMNEQLAQAKASRILNAMGFPNPAANLISSIAQQQNVNIPTSDSTNAMAPMSSNLAQFQRPLTISEIPKESNVEKEEKIEKDASKTELNQNSDNVVVQPESPRNAQNSSCYGDDVPLSSNIEITEADVKIEATETSGVAIVEMPNEESEDEEKHESTQFPGPSNTTFQNSNLHQNPHSGYQFPNPMMNSSLPDQNDFSWLLSSHCPTKKSVEGSQAG
ncbi:unnamed protein product [Oikopleura dioica]|uniref:Uncharacterized protein n=1 Tax=Oikopleura dioica TaxID=34765 RepID=E4WZJ1_OIKDI|nr:unnamed protein product [Oikopleura dioica]